METPRRRSVLRTSLAAIVPALVLAAFLLQLILNVKMDYFPRSVLSINRLVLAAGAVPLAALAAFAALRGAKPQLAWLGAGVLTLGLAVFVANLASVAGAVEPGIKIQNLGVLVAGIFHLVGSLNGPGWTGPARPAPRHRAVVLAACYGLSVLAVALIGLLSATGMLPPFFVAGAGGTPLRQGVLIIAMSLFGGSSLLQLVAASRIRSSLLFVYGLGLSLISLGQLGYLFSLTSGDFMSWLGRSGQWLGSVYFLAACLVVFRRSGPGWTGFEEAIRSHQRASESGHPFDVVILDLTVAGGMGGLETVKKLHELDPRVKAIVSSGYSADATMSEYWKYGFSAVLKKPYSAANLEEALRILNSSDSPWTLR